MPVTQFKRVVFGAKKDITLAKFNMGLFTNAVAFDLEEFGKKGVQGMVIEGKNVESLVKYWKKAATEESNCYLMAGTAANGHLYIAVRDKNDVNWEQLSIAVKDYASKREQLAKNNTEVVNLQPGDKVIDGAVGALEDKHKVKAKTEDNAELSKITGNIVLSAHGTPDTLKGGRVVGSHLAGKTPEELVDMLVDRGLKSEYSGRLDLSGCFTASGGPSASEKDATYAEKVLKVLRKKGYAKVSVEAWPGPMYTTRETGKDSVGTTQERGDEGVWANKQNEKAMGESNESDEKIKPIRENIIKIAEAFKKIAEPMPKTRPTTAGQDQDEWDQNNEKLKKLKEKYDEYMVKFNTLNSIEAKKTFAHYKGVFGLRTI